VADESNFFNDLADWSFRLMGGRLLFVTITRKTRKKKKTLVLKIPWTHGLPDHWDEGGVWRAQPSHALMVPEGGLYFYKRSTDLVDVILKTGQPYSEDAVLTYQDLLWMDDFPWYTVAVGDEGEGFHDCSCQFPRGTISWKVSAFH
jgi:hypothetical protein